MPPGRRAEVLAAARAAGAFLIEDDTARMLALDAEPPPAMVRGDPDGHVVHLVSLTKVTAASLRVGALVARGPAASRLRSLRAVDDFFVPQPMQEAATELLGSTAWTRHLGTLPRALLAPRDARLAALAGHAPQLVPGPVPRGGLHLWCRLPDGTDDTEVARQCEQRGLLIGSGTPYHAAEPPAPYLRLTYCAEPPDRLARAARALGDLLGAGLAR